MLNERTLFVLGAGASADFGMPLGDVLSIAIASKVNLGFEYGHKQVSGDPDLMEVLRAIAQREDCDVKLYRAAGCQHRSENWILSVHR